MPSRKVAEAAKVRHTKTPAQRAQEAFDVADRRVAVLDKKRATLRTQLDEVQADYETALTRRDYLANNPDLPSVNPPTTVEE